MNKLIKCELCGIKIGIEQSGRHKHPALGSYYFCNTIMAKNAANQEYCKECYNKLLEEKQ